MKIYNYGNIGSMRQYIYPIKEISDSEVTFIYCANSTNLLHNDSGIDMTQICNEFANIVTGKEIQLDNIKGFIEKYGYINKINELIHKSKDREENGEIISYISGVNEYTINLDDFKKEVYIFNALLRLITLKQDITGNKFIMPFPHFDIVKERVIQYYKHSFDNVFFEAITREGGRPLEIINKLRAEYSLLIESDPFNDSWSEISTKCEEGHSALICKSIDDLYNFDMNGFNSCGVFKLIDAYIVSLVSCMIKNIHPALRISTKSGEFISQFEVNDLLELIYYTVYTELTDQNKVWVKCDYCGNVFSEEKRNYGKKYFVCGICKENEINISGYLKSARRNKRRSVVKEIEKTGLMVPDGIKSDLNLLLEFAYINRVPIKEKNKSYE